MAIGLEAVAPGASSTDGSPRPSPFRGLEPYSKQDRMKLFGRDTDLLMVRDRIFASPTTVLMAGAGTGKTSFIDALLAPDLSERFAEHYDVVVHRSFSTLDPWAGVASAIAARRPRCGLILILDQFEEVFQHSAASPALCNLRAGLRALTSESRVRVVLSLREDFLAQLVAFEDVLNDVLRNYHRLAPPNREQAIDIVVRTARPTPVSQTGVERLVDGLAYENGVIILPYLQIAGRRLWLDESQTNRAEFEFLAQFAEDAPDDAAAHQRVLGLMKAHLVEQLAALSSSERQLAAHAVNFLVTSQGAKLPYEIKSLAKHMGEKELAVLPALEKLSSARVLKRTQRDDETWFELYHDMYAGALFEWSRRVEQERRDRLINTVLAAVVLVIGVVGAVLVGYRMQQQWQKAALTNAERVAAEGAKNEQRYQSLLERAREREGLELPGEALLLRLAAQTVIEHMSESNPADEKLQKKIDEGRRELSRLIHQLHSLRATLRMEGTNAHAFFLSNGRYLATVSDVTSPVDAGALKSGPTSEPNATNAAPAAATPAKPALHSLVQLWSAATGQPHREALVVDGKVSAGDLSSDHRFLALRDGRQTQIWDLGNEDTPRRQLATDSCFDARFVNGGERDRLIVKCLGPFKLRSYAALPALSFESFSYPDGDATVGDDVMLMYPGGTARLDSKSLKVLQRYDLSSGERPLQVEGNSKWVWALTRLTSNRFRVVVFDRDAGDYRSRTTLNAFDTLNVFNVVSFEQSRLGESILLGQSAPGYGLQELGADGQSLAELRFTKALVPRSAGNGARWLALQPADWGSDRATLWSVLLGSRDAPSSAVPLAVASTGLDVAGDSWIQSNSQATQLMSSDGPEADGVNAQVLSTTDDALLYRIGNQIHFRDAANWKDSFQETSGVISASLSSDGKHAALATSSEVMLWDLGRNALRRVIQLNGPEEVSLAPRAQRLLVTSWTRTRLFSLDNGTPEPVATNGVPGATLWSPDGAFFTLHKQDRLYATATVQAPTAMQFGGSSRISVFSPNSAWLLSGGPLGARLTPLRGGPDIDNEGLGPPALAAFSKDSSKFAVMSESREVHIVDVETRRTLSAVTLRVSPRELRITPDGKGLLVASERWLHLYRPQPETPQTLRLMASRQLAGTWSGVLHFMQDDGFRVVAVTGKDESYVRREDVAFVSSAVAGVVKDNAQQLLDGWSKKLGLSLSNDDVSVVGVIGAPKATGADSSQGHGRDKTALTPPNPAPKPRGSSPPRPPAPRPSATP